MNTETDTTQAELPSDPRPRSGMGLSARLLLLTVAFVMVAEFLIYAPSISRFRKVYMEDHIAKAHLAALALQATPDNMVSDELEEELLKHAGAYAIILHFSKRKMLALSHDMPPEVDVVVNLNQAGFTDWIGDAFAALGRNDDRVMRVIGPSPRDPTVTVEVVMDEAPMRAAMINYSTRILQLSVVISLITAGLIFLSLQLLMVRPIRRITKSMIQFRENPENRLSDIVPGVRGDEIGVAGRELAVMQDDLRQALSQKSRLAALGSAVAKINHDLRNSLATAVLASDKLAGIDDPEVQKLTPRLYNAIDKAVSLCSQTLNYVSDPAPRMRPDRFHLHELIVETAAMIRMSDDGDENRSLRNDVPMDMDIVADRDQMLRVMSNLALNAFEAGAEVVTVLAERGRDGVNIRVSDDGPGMTQKAQDHLFEPFAGSGRDGGSGLGLVIAREIMRAHGGDVALDRTSDDGTSFLLDLPGGDSI